MQMLLVLIISLNAYSGVIYLKSANSSIGHGLNSWKALNSIARDVFNNNDHELGYFIYTPDKLSYQIKYAMLYESMQHPNIKAHYFEKNPVTYIVAEPPPANDQYAKYFTDSWWTLNSLKIEGSPKQTMSYPNGYKWLKYQLDPSQISIPWDKQEDTGIHFR